MKRRFRYLLTALLLSGAAAEAFDPQRELFKAAERALQQQNRALFETLAAGLESYPLYPQLVYRDLRQRMGDHPAAEIEAFLEAYADTPLAEQLRKAWLIHLAKQQRWDDFLDGYRPSEDAALDCYHRQAWLAKDREERALDAIEGLWMNGYSQPQSCDPVFARWRERGGFTPERVWRRFSLAMQENQLSLARYLRTLMQGEARKTADLWLQVHQQPRRVLDSAGIDIDKPHMSDVLLYGIRRWSNRDSVAARQALDVLMHRYGLPRGDESERNQLDRLERRLALFLASRGHPSAAARLDALPDSVVDDEVAAWKVRVYLPKGAWSKVLQQLDCMTPEQRQQAQWRYWRARALEARLQGREARIIYQSLAEERNYYGFLAADRLGTSYRITPQSSAVDPQVLLDVQRLPAMRQAREYYLLGRVGAASTHWNAAMGGFDKAQRAAAAQLAYRWGWYDRAIISAARAEVWDDLELRFPLPYRDEVLAYAQQRRIDPAWVYAVMRQESLFRSDAKSAAGALGLMQIMPATARKIADDLQTFWSGSHVLLRPDTNIRYGTYYLRYTLDKLQNNPLLATAAYNAGPHRVATWLPDLGSLAADVWAETIPYSETRKYVKRVMEYAAVYEYRLGRAQTSMDKRMMRISSGA